MCAIFIVFKSHRFNRKTTTIPINFGIKII
nr:MAG TPA: hypothetical protein [Caudoviricetes sp.]